MKTHLARLCWKIVWIFVAIVVICAMLIWRLDNAAQKAAEETRRSLRQQGFKTDLADFDLSTSPELRGREAILKAAAPARRFSQSFENHPNLMEAVGSNSAIVVWKLESLKKQNPSWPDNSDELAWEEFRDALNENQAALDAASVAVLSGPMRFDLNASHGNAMLLPHLAPMKNLMQTLGSRSVLALHDGDPGAAWTNLLAETRLVTAWEPEPAQVSHLVRFAATALAFDALWQALQTNGWADGQLARLQTEWESASFFTNLPETAAFKRASDVAFCRQDRQGISSPGPTLADFIKMGLHSPSSLWSELNYCWNQASYRKRGTYEDEKALLLFHRDRELELRIAVQAPTWAAMRQLPGATNIPYFQSKYRSRMQAMLNMHAISMQFSREGTSLLGRAAQAEAQRRLIIAAIALERYRRKHGSYPNTVSELAPEFLKNPPVDFMDGQPLRYRLAEDGHFLLYSIGLDGVDDGGQMPSREQQRPTRSRPDSVEATLKGDLVWPLPASIADVKALRRREERAKQIQDLRQQERESNEEWNQSPLRRARVGKILATKWSDVVDTPIEGRSLSEIMRNDYVTGTNRLSLAELLTPRQVITGGEPEDLTFEFPVSYDAITNRGFFLLLDADLDPQALFAADSGAKMQDRSRATNGDCLLVWHTIYDPPGQHALQVEWTWTDQKGGEYWGRGPAISVVTSNLCQFSLASARFDPEIGAPLQARLPESNGNYTVEFNATNGALLKTITGSTSNGVIQLHWDLIDDHGQRFTNDSFNSVFHIILPDSRRAQTLKGP